VFVSPYLFLALAAVVLFVIIVVGVALVVTTVVGHLSKVDISHQQHGLLRHAYDEGGPDDLAVMADAVSQVAESTYTPRVVVVADLHRGHSGDPNVDQSRVLSENDDKNLPSSPDVLRSLSVLAPPDEQFREK
jgi:hypothetical protein